ncbi:unnamed protein product [Phytophthora fragariaefolia]|uniref:Unnamed protein product n=1 Tax=Phytophthora fragariaefolia TaxID=1490495 RepID=A0A9W6Y4D0_9STRA|nr:unnamed protein product [Phytophthora fragariaefolia]
MRREQMKEESLIESAAMYTGEIKPTFEYSDYEDLYEAICLNAEDAMIKFEFTLKNAYRAFEAPLGDGRFYPNVQSFKLRLIEQIERERLSIVCTDVRWSVFYESGSHIRGMVVVSRNWPSAQNS